jgi:hypothetical protein
MKSTKAKGPKAAQGSKPAKPEADPRPVIDPALLEDVGWFLDDPEAWFYRPNHEFEGRAPIELLGTPDEAMLRNCIQATKYGQFL